MRIRVPNELAENEAWGRIKKCFDNLKVQHSDKISNVKVNWAGNSATIDLAVRVPRWLRLSGVLHISATLSVTAREIIVEGPLPFGSGVFQGRIETVLRDHLEKCLA